MAYTAIIIRVSHNFCAVLYLDIFIYFLMIVERYE